jgi:cAMP-binding proteins - catabolite gene activator and regulatory subunit of cAMP-dependent protein kinases
MFEIFEQYIEKVIPGITKEQVSLMQNKCTIKTLRKKEVLLKEGEICHYKIFVTKGLLRNYNIGEKGNEYILRFVDTEYWTTDPESYFSGLPSKYYIDAIEPSEVAMFHYDDFKTLRQQIPVLNDYTEALFTETATHTQNRLLINISATAEEKYTNFMNTHSEIFHRVPLHMIASYLGVSRETLTRVRQILASRPSF